MALWAGMRGTGDWTTDVRPFHWRKEMLRIIPHGDLILTAIMGNMRVNAVDDPKYNSWRKVQPTMAADLTGEGVYANALLSTAYAAAASAVAGDVVYCKMALADVLQFKPRHVVLLRDSDDTTVDVLGEVRNVVENGASSYISVELMEADNTAAPDLSTVDRVKIVGTLSPEGGTPPAAIAVDPESDYNYTQIFWDTLSQTGTAIATKNALRTPDDYMEAKMDCYSFHGQSMENAAIYSERTERTDGSTGKKKRTTRGILRAIAADAYAGTYNVANFTTLTTVTDDTTNFAGLSWEQGGNAFISLMLKRRARYSTAKTVLGICGDGALLGIQRLVEANGMMKLETRQVEYGIEVKRWTSVFGTIDLKTHPLYSHEPTDNFRVTLIEPEQIEFRPLATRDTKFLKDPNFDKGGDNAIDARNEGYRTEGGLDFRNIRGFADLTGVGQNNTQG